MNRFHDLLLITQLKSTVLCIINLDFEFSLGIYSNFLFKNNITGHDYIPRLILFQFFYLPQGNVSFFNMAKT